MHVAGLLRCGAEANTALGSGYTPIKELKTKEDW